MSGRDCGLGGEQGSGPPAETTNPPEGEAGPQGLPRARSGWAPYHEPLPGGERTNDRLYGVKKIGTPGLHRGVCQRDARGYMMNQQPVGAKD